MNEELALVKYTLTVGLAVVHITNYYLEQVEESVMNHFFKLV